MSKPTVVYLIMLAVLIAGLWAVLEMGGYLVAPEDLAGKWQLSPADQAPSTQPAGNLTIEQSGRFFQLAFDQGNHLDLKLKEPADSSMILVNDPWQVTIMGPVGGDDKTIQVDGPQPGRWLAHRMVRTFAADVPGQEAK